jgi:hypothetical protein
VKKFLVLLSFLFLSSCFHATKNSTPIKEPEWIFCDHIQDILDQKIKELHEGLLQQENVINAIFSDFRIACEEHKAYAGWTVVLEMQGSTDKNCASFKTIVSFTDEPNQIVYELLYISEGEPAECLTSS